MYVRKISRIVAITLCIAGCTKKEPPKEQVAAQETKKEEFVQFDDIKLQFIVDKAGRKNFTLKKEGKISFNGYLQNSPGFVMSNVCSFAVNVTVEGANKTFPGSVEKAKEKLKKINPAMDWKSPKGYFQLNSTLVRNVEGASTQMFETKVADILSTYQRDTKTPHLYVSSSKLTFMIALDDNAAKSKATPSAITLSLKESQEEILKNVNCAGIFDKQIKIEPAKKLN